MLMSSFILLYHGVSLVYLSWIYLGGKASKKKKKKKVI